jgi:hypothetical protein
MTTPLVRSDDAPAFEDEVRAMLARRAADVLPAPAAAPAEPPVDIRLTDPGGPGGDGRWRFVAAAAAAVVLVAGVATFAATRDPGAPTAETGLAQPLGPPIVWPLDDHVPADVLASPDTAAAAYLSEVVDGIDVSTLEPPVVDGDTASVGYTLRGVPGAVELRLDGGAWGVTGAINDAVDLDVVKAVDGGIVAELSLGPAARPDMQLRLSAVTDAGTPAGVLSQFKYVDSGIISVVDGAAPIGHEGDSVVLLPGDPAPEHGQAMLAVILDDVDADSLAALRLDALADDDGDPATPDVVIGHATRAVGDSRDAPAADTPSGESPTSTAVDPATPPSAPTTAAPAAPAAGVATHVEGTFRGQEEFRPTDGGCPDLDHVLISTFELTDGTTWDFRADYCGTVNGDDWSGGGTFAFTTPDADTLTGTFTSAASVTSDGEPYVLTITGGSGRFAGATGSCTLDNHLTDTGPGAQEHDGPFTCDITVPTSG